jgi:outer membrane protein OmpA-like peptidoglycan-associated protein
LKWEFLTAVTERRDETQVSREEAMKKLFFAIAAAAMLVPGAASATLAKDLAAAKAITASGPPFTRALHAEYTALGDEAYRESDHLHARRFIRKALAAAHGEEPAPENPRSWFVPSRSRQALYDNHGRLIAALAAGRNDHPRAAAHAQAMFDCWLEEEHEDIWLRAPGVTMYQPEDIAKCRDGFMAAMAELAGPAPAAAKPAPLAAKPAPAPAPAPIPQAPPPAQEFAIFFAFDKAALDSAAIGTIDRVAAAARAYLPARISVFGHTDRAGPVAYNVGLSKRRAKAVVDALVARGIAANRMISSSFGESRPRVPTADGVAHPKNRRAEITVQ